MEKYECHITIEPVFGEKLEEVKALAASRGFRIAELLMCKRAEDTPERSRFDTFMTGHADNFIALTGKSSRLVRELNTIGVKVWRRKVEQIILDIQYE